jgi:hypothetical protein
MAHSFRIVTGCLLDLMASKKYAKSTNSFISGAIEMILSSMALTL